MKHPDKMRKAIGLLLAPLAFAALPASAYTLDVNYWGDFEDREVYEGYDENNTHYFFVLSDDKATGSVVSIEAAESSVTLPEAIKWTSSIEEYDPETDEVNYVTKENLVDITGIEFNTGYYWWYTTFPNSALHEIYLTEKIIEGGYNWDGGGPNKIHFVTENVPENLAINRTMSEGRIVIFAPEESVDNYKAAFDSSTHMVLAEGTDPEEAFKKEVEALNALIIEYDDNCVPYASYSATDKDGTLYAFESPSGNYDQITFRGAITTASKLNIPEKVYIVNWDNYGCQDIPVTRFCLDYYNDENTGFPGCTNLTDIYVPECLTYAEFHGEGYAGKFKFHFTSEEAPAFRMYDESGDNLAIYVPDALFETYSTALGEQDYILFSETAATPVTVNVATPGTLAEKISTVIENLEGVRWLVVTGTPDEVDLRMIRRLPRLEILDLSATTGLQSVGGCNGLKYLREVKLPDGITSLDAGTFYQCRNLQTINIPEGVETLGATAFYETRNLRSLDLPASVKTIGNNCFYRSGIRSMNLENVERVEEAAFHYAPISNVDLSSAKYIGYDAFSETRIGTLVLGKELTHIGPYAFHYAHITGTLEIPEKVTEIEYYSFAGNDEISKIILHKNIIDISESAFERCQPETVECNVLFPLDNNGFRYSDVSNTTLYVPALTLNNYLLHDNWVNFTNIEVLPNDLTVIDLDREYELKSDKGIADKATLNMFASRRDNNTAYGHLTVNREADLNLGVYNHSARAYEGWYWDPNYGDRWNAHYTGSTIIPETKVTADNITLSFILHRNQWAFLSFPFDINVKDIKVDDDALWVVRKYSGEARAKLEENTWQNMTDETVLKAGEGYIFNCDVEGRDEVTFIFTPAANGNALFTTGSVSKELNEYSSEFAHNASWNLAGNTYPAYLNLNAIDFEAPVTVWEGGTYAAYSPIDDELVLDPFQAFFVQRQSVEGGDKIAINPEGRAHSREAAADLDLSAPATRAAGVNANRSLFNISVKGENGQDRTRIVVNEQASAAYEANCDASKFMSTMESVPQIFVNNAGVRMAINEAPLGNGQFILGTRFGQAGSYTISLDTRNAAAYSVLLTDNVTGVTSDITASAYTFNAEAGLNENRFTVTIGALSGVEGVAAEDLGINVEGNVLNISTEEAVEIVVVAADGKVIASEKSNSFSASLEQGIYIVKVGNATTKVNVGK